MLVLTAVVKSPHLQHIAKEEEYHKLLRRTIKFLRDLSKISPTCARDCQILEQFSNNLFDSKDNQELRTAYAGEGVMDTSLSGNGSFSSGNGSFSFRT